MNTEERESLRDAVLDVLNAYPTIPRTQSGIARETRKCVGFPAANEEVEAALTLLLGLGLVQYQTKDTGAIRWWSITSAGMLRCERGGFAGKS